jgi:hypothetical protein
MTDYRCSIDNSFLLLGILQPIDDEQHLFLGHPKEKQYFEITELL